MVITPAFAAFIAMAVVLAHVTNLTFVDVICIQCSMVVMAVEKCRRQQIFCYWITAISSTVLEWSEQLLLSRLISRMHQVVEYFT